VSYGDAAAAIENTYYHTVADAISAAGTAQTTIKLLKDTTENVQVPSGKSIVLDLNGKKLTNTGASDTIYVANGGTL
jgi:cation transport ATPase